jgi:hypothetical protein
MSADEGFIDAVLDEVPAPRAAARVVDATDAAAQEAGTYAPVPVECPSCGTTSRVDYARRDAQDFCRVCDFPLFWSRDRVPVADEGPGDGSALRRLPGTAGRAALASLLCPSCTEPNPPSGELCVRCGEPLRPVAAPQPVVEPEALPEPELVPEPAFRWWPYVAASVAALVVLVTLLIVFDI